MQQDLLIFISIAGLLFMGWPGIEIFRGFMPQYIFIVWGLLIGAAAFVLTRGTGKNGMR
ncbi:MAG: hypothetical protein JXR79_05935 [Nitrospirae bacterium]|nr:hypothetical protein [Nitrospirota bacterium]